VATVHALSWLVVANAVGLLLALLLVAPRLGVLLGPFTYGRWMPVHLDVELYGWSSLPVVAVLLRFYRADEMGRSREAALALQAWSGTLLFGAIGWLRGSTSGKPYLDWSGPSRVLFVAAMLLLAAVLASAWARTFRHPPGAKDARPWPSAWSARPLAARSAPRVPGAPGVTARTASPLPRSSGAAIAGRGVLLAALTAVPVALYWAASPRVHPPINPATSGPTGTSLLGSALAAIAILAGGPLLAGLESRDGRRATTRLFVALAIHFAVFAALDHGDRPHRDGIEIAAVASTLLWIPLLDRHLRRLRWPPSSARWLHAFRLWWALLVSSAVVAFLPGVLDRVKFTNALVAHAHVAMAGALSSFLVLLLQAANRDTALGAIGSDRAGFLAWNGGAALMIAALVAVGVLEARAPGTLFRPDAVVDALYGVRAVAGVAMLLASVGWLRAALRATARSRLRASEEDCEIALEATP
jgi:cytochrome c oxidase cbb3-type subunit 1